ncbi:MAG: hypothetical protein E6R04_08095 [Spirochaetes bacterium]|nr:MAG: hypothetical protein E6R04_08095 [Spirochaetota bacterium]
MSKTTAWFSLPEKFDTDTAEEIAQDIVDFIRRRSEKGVGIKPGKYGVVSPSDEKEFAGYSKSYIESLDFKIAGKSKKVDLTLSGDMLASVEFDKIRQKRGSTEILIGVFDEDVAPRAEGNILGTYGDMSRKNKNAIARNFLGITESDLAKILRKYEQD